MWSDIDGVFVKTEGFGVEFTQLNTSNRAFLRPLHE